MTIMCFVNAFTEFKQHKIRSLSYAFPLGLERYWHWVIGYWVIFTDIG